MGVRKHGYTIAFVLALVMPFHQAWACACDDDQEVVCSAGEAYDPKTHECTPVPLG